ncbi:MAG: family 78 glycoside hydrolase catalytic domain [Clostridia bacterium]|nr:family 78 glycoside hydrolase catalytic domain [Clostridia bacterium]
MLLSKKFIIANNKFSRFSEFVPAPYFRKEFSLDFKPESAEITICGLGFYELYINGKNITKGPLAPYISNPDDLYYYDHYDISSLLCQGVNVIGIILGNGFRNCYGGFMWDLDKVPGCGPVTLAVHLEAKSGEKSFSFEADETFKTHPSPILYDDLRMGYCYDSRLEIPDWNMPGFDDSRWQNALLAEAPTGIAKLCCVEPIVVTHELKAVSIKHYDRLAFAHDKHIEGLLPIENSFRNNVYVYDFGINSAGVTRIKINGKPGQKITIRHAEHTIRGEFSVNTTVFQRKNNLEFDQRYRDFGQTDVFICKGGEETFIPKFKYDGFRYAYIEGLDEEQATEDAIVFMVMNSDIKSRGEFCCSDKIINALQTCTRNADLANFYYFPTDCPHREKNGWTADAWMSAEQMLLNFTVEKSLKEWMVNVACAQRDDGALPGIVPTRGWGFEWGNGPVWDSVCVEVPYAVYKYTGDKSIIKQSTDLIMKYLKYMVSTQDKNGLTVWGLGDWCDPFVRENGEIASPLEVTASIAAYNIAIKAEFLFSQISLAEESEYAHRFAAKMRKSIREHLIDYNTMTVKGDCQTSQALALAMGIFNPNEKEHAQNRLLEIIHRDGDINTCGVFGIRYIYHVLSEMGEADLAHKIITSKSRTCYGHWIEKGATALCESFEDFDSPYVNSRNHHFFGDISSWFIQEIAGLKPNPDADDISCFEISPSFVKAIDFAKASFASEYGKVFVHWEKQQNENIMLSVEIPRGIHGKIVLPRGYRFADAGTTNNLKCGLHQYEIALI